MKKILAIILAAIMSLTLLACNQTNENEPTSAPATEAQKATDAPKATEAQQITDAPATETPVPTANPFYSALTSEAGYTVNLEDMEFPEEESYELVAISEITDSATKQAFLDAGHKETDKVLHLMGTSNNSYETFCGNWESILNATEDSLYEEFYSSGNEYDITIESYAPKENGYIIELDGSSGNHILAGPGVIKSGYNKSTTNAKVNGNGYQLTFYLAPVDTYIAEITFKQIVHEKKYSYMVDELKVKEITSTDLLNYTYDFSDNNIPDLGINGDYIKIADADSELQAKLSAANGFKDYAFHSSNGQFGFYFMNDNFTSGKTYTIKLRVYVDMDLTDYKPDLSEYFAHLLPLDELTDYSTSGHQLADDNGYENQINFTASPVEGLANVYDVTGNLKCTDDEILYSAMIYNNQAAKNIYVASISVVAD